MGRCPTGTVPGGCQSELQTQVNPHRSAKAHSNSSLKHVIRQLWRCLDPTFMSAAPHYGLRYGCAPATGNFQRLRGRSPVAQSSELRSLPGQLSCRASFGDVRGDKQGLATRAALPTQPPQDLQRNLAVLCGVLTPRSPCTERADTG